MSYDFSQIEIQILLAPSLTSEIEWDIIPCSSLQHSIK